MRAGRPTPDNPPLTVKVLVLNYDPRVSSEQNRRLSEVFKWAAPERLATRYKSEMEFASGGSLRFEIVEWRNLNEIYAQRDGYRYTPDEYTFNRRKNGDWHDGGGQDYPRVLAEQGVAPLIDAGTIDEVWIFSDHYFGLWEASMAGPGAFNINGGVYPEVPTQRPFAFYGFNYERGTAEMMHNTCHRTEATMNRVYGQWKLENPQSNWDKFSANDVQSDGAAGVGTCHWPANAKDGYDYGNERTVESWADDFLNYPKLTFAKKPVSRTSWLRQGEIANQTNNHMNYMAWYFAHIPRTPGVNPDGRQNNWWKYMMDFQNYAADGKPKPLSARVTVRNVFVPRSQEHRFRVAYNGATPVDVSSIDNNDFVATGPNGFRQAAKLVDVSDRENGTHRVATYSLAAPAGGWKAAQHGSYRLALQSNQVRDTLGNALSAEDLGTFEVKSAEFESLKPDIAALELFAGENHRIHISAIDKAATQRGVDDDVLWTTADANIATVDATGLIRAHKPGKAQITASLGSLTQTIPVTVRKSDAPQATLESRPSLATDRVAYEFTVKYAAVDALVPESIGFGDIRVTGPRGFQQFADLVAVKPSADVHTATATYRVVPPGRKWWSAGNGTYVVEMKGWQVTDTKALSVPDGILGTFTVTAKESEPADSQPPTTPPGENLPSKRPKNAGKKKV